MPQLIPVGFDEIEPEPAPDLVTVRVYSGAKVAVAVRAWLMVTVQVDVPVHAPNQPVKREPAAAVAVSVTRVPDPKYAVQVAPQFTPPTFEVTPPEPAPERVTVNRYWAVNVAVTLRAAVMESTHVPVPVHAPDQPENTKPVAAAAVSVTVVPDANAAEQALPQLIPVTSDVTVPVPDFVTVAVKAGENDAVALRAFDMTSEQVVVSPLQSPDQPVNTEPDAADAVSVTDVPAVSDAEHEVPHEIPPVLDDTEPEPVPLRETASA